MTRRLTPALLAGAVVLALAWAAPARAQSCPPNGCQPICRYFYYPYYYFPHSYWPSMSPRWPEPAFPASYCPKPAPAYMAYPPFKEPMWRYEFFEPQSFHRGFHFWLDQL